MVGVWRMLNILLLHSWSLVVCLLKLTKIFLVFGNLKKAFSCLFCCLSPTLFVQFIVDIREGKEDRGVDFEDENGN